MEFRYQFGTEIITVRVEKLGADYAVTVNGQTYTVRVAQHSQFGEFALTINGVRRTAFVAADGPRRWVAWDGDAQPFVLSVPQSGRAAKRERASGHDSLEAQMPSLVRRVLVSAGDAVERGQVLLLLEAMKMEMRITAPHAGTVEKVFVSEGQAVERGQMLVEVAGKE